MDISLNRIKQEIKRIFVPPKIVLGRSACVGHDVLRAKMLLDLTDVKFINIQKGRLDLLLSWINGELRPKSSIVKPYIIRQDIAELIQQQSKLKWLKINDPDYLLIDIYSELTDQKFTHKQEGWSFCCHWSDINHKTNFEEIFSCEGLLPAEKFEEVYDNFFTWFKNSYPGKKIVIVYYTAKYDHREIFNSRVAKIKEVIIKQKEKHKFIYSLDIDENQFFCFPYHYTHDTIDSMVDKWVELEKNEQKSVN